jgi:hypothetical protein
VPGLDVLQNMRLSRSAWKTHRNESPYEDYIQILPDDGIIITYSSVSLIEERIVIWGCWIHDEGDSVVYTAVKNAKVWKRESYNIQGNQLIWNNGCGHGVAVWDAIDECDIPAHFLDRAAKFIEKFLSLHKPEFIKAEQAASSNH